MLSSKKFLRKLVFWLFENVVALLQYNNQAAAAVIILGIVWLTLCCWYSWWFTAERASTYKGNRIDSFNEVG
jgi:hypothetical protein